MLYAKLEHKLFAAYCALDQSADALLMLKSEFCAAHQVTSRQFNACWMLLQGKIRSRVEVDALARMDVQTSLKSIRSYLTKLGRQKKPHSTDQKRILANKRCRFAKLEGREAELTDGKLHLCFGSKKLFRQQYDLEGNGYASFEDWRAQWKDARSNTFYLMGSKDETNGNQSCTPTVAENGTFSLRVRIPDALLARNNGDKHLELTNVWFEHGHLELLAALDEGTAISFKFLRDKKGWRILASTDRPDFRKAFSAQVGVLGIDINADHLALTEVDRFGNLVKVHRIDCTTQGLSSGQRKSVTQHAAKETIALSKTLGLPAVMEKLDFKKKKRELSASKGDPKAARRARQLSAFHYSAVGQALHSSALLADVPLKEINPAYTSVIGQVKYAKRLGVSVHQAAALAIGRRGMGYHEHVPVRADIPDDKGDHLIVEFPVRKRSAHEWSHWARVRGAVQTTLAEWFRLKKLSAQEGTPAAQAAQGPS